MRDNVELLAMLEKYKEHQDGKKATIKIADLMKKQRKEMRKAKRMLKSKVEANEKHQRDNIDAKGYPEVADK